MRPTIQMKTKTDDSKKEKLSFPFKIQKDVQIKGSEKGVIVLYNSSNSEPNMSTLAKATTLHILSFLTGLSQQTVQTQIRMLIEAFMSSLIRV